MTYEDSESDPKSSASPHSRRGEPSESPIIEGVAQELPQRAADEAATADGPQPSRPRSSSGFRVLVLASLIVSIVALAASGLLWYRILGAGQPRGDDQADVGRLDARVDALERKTAASGDVQQRFGALESAANSATAAANSASSTAKSANSTAKSAAATAESASAAADAAQQQAKQAAAIAQSIQNAKAAPAAGPTRSDVDALGRRVKALEQQPSAASVQASLSGKLTSLGQSIDKLQSALDALGSRVANLSALSQHVSDLEARVSAQAGRLPPLEALLHAPTVDANALKASNAEAVADARASALVVVAQALQRAVDAGSPFAQEKAAADELGADPQQVQALSASAPTGVATAAQLFSAFKPLVGPILAGVDGAQRGGALDRVASELGKLVEIHSLGSGAGDAPAALVGRMESDLERGDVAGALEARNSLPGPAKTITEDWAARARALLAARDAAHAILEDAIRRIGKAPK